MTESGSDAGTNPHQEGSYSNPDKSGVLQSALEYAKRGWHIFPVRGGTDPTIRGSKAPALEIKSWAKEATTNPQLIAAWFAGSGYGIGVSCELSGLIMMDGDRLSDVPQDLLPLLDAHGWKIKGDPFRASWIFNAPDGTDYGNTAGNWPAGEVRGNGGYFIAPPSYHFTGGTYKTISIGDMALPKAIEALLVPRAIVPETIDPSAEHTLTNGRPCRIMSAVYSKHVAAFANKDSRYDAMVTGLLALYGRSAAGHSGGALALAHFRKGYIESLGTDKGRLYGSDGEWARAIAKVPTIVAGTAPEKCTGDNKCGMPLALEVSDPESAFWASTEILDRIKGHADHALMNPWAVLGAALTFVVAETDHKLIIPGPPNPAPLNIFTIIYGGSTSGKSSAIELARRMLEHDHAISTHWQGIGTGQGVAAHFVRGATAKEMKDDVDCPEYIRINYRLGIEIDEISQLLAVIATPGSIVLPTLLSAFSGRTLGQANAHAENKRLVERMSYRLCVLVGVLPSSARNIFSRADDGFPQRFIWMPAQITKAVDIPEPPMGFGWRPSPYNATVSMTLDEGDIRVVEYPQIAIDERRSARLASALGTDAYIGRRTELKSRVSAAMAQLHGRTDVTEEYWALAEAYMLKSDATSTNAIEEAKRHHINSEIRKGVIGDYVTDEVRRVASVKGVDRVSQLILRKLREKGPMHRKQIRDAIHMRDRQHIGEALQMLLDQGAISEEAIGRGVLFSADL